MHRRQTEPTCGVGRDRVPPLHRTTVWRAASLLGSRPSIQRATADDSDYQPDRPGRHRCNRLVGLPQDPPLRLSDRHRVDSALRLVVLLRSLSGWVHPTPAPVGRDSVSHCVLPPRNDRGTRASCTGLQSAVSASSMGASAGGASSSASSSVSSTITPTARRTWSWSCMDSSGLSRRNSLAFSLPCPS